MTEASRKPRDRRFHSLGAAKEAAERHADETTATPSEPGA